jgi:phage tail-like protein
VKRNDITRLLPAVFQAADLEGSALAGLLDLMEQLHVQPEAELADLDRVLDPARTPDPFVPFLARWVDLGLEVTTGLDRLRALVANAVDLSRWRGTARGLVAFLEIASGATGFEVDDAVLDEAGLPRPFHLRVTAPARLLTHDRMLARIIELEKPAYVTYELAFRGA